MIGALREVGIWVNIASPSKPDAVMLVSREDYSAAIARKWTLDNNGYAVARFGKKKLSFHRIVASAAVGQVVDHINRDQLDNRRRNLRIDSGGVNSHNRSKGPKATSKFAGVCWNRAKAKWIAQIKRGGVYKHVGQFDSEHQAAAAYDKVARQMYGQDASLNFPCGALSWTR